jgi:pyruvate-ferredoxin/flavodoxin oxidoreductase
LVRSCEERLQFWHQLKDLAGLNRGEASAVDETAIANRVRQELIQKLSSGMSITSGDAAQTVAVATPVAAADGYEAPWIDTPECTACDECMNINAKIFGYNDQKKAVVLNATAGTFLDIVKAAEKCTAGVIHPGTPWNMKEANLEKLKQRAAKFN